MNLSQLLTRVANGPSKGLALCGAGSGVIPDPHVPEAVSKCMSALTALHTRFPLQLKLLTIATIDGIFEYPLRPEFAQSSGSAEINKFIVDSVDKPYTGDLLAIEHVLDANSAELPLNDRRDPLSWFSPAHDTVHCGYPVTGETYFVQYRADHAPLSEEDLDAKISIPASLLDALITKVAYEYYCGQDGEGAQAKEQYLNQKYEAICQEIEGRNTLNSSVVENRADQIVAAGWV